MESQIKIKFKKAAFNYDASIYYRADSRLIIGEMNKVCIHCGALRFKDERKTICCNHLQSYISIM